MMLYPYGPPRLHDKGGGMDVVMDRIRQNSLYSRVVVVMVAVVEVVGDLVMVGDGL